MIKQLWKPVVALIISAALYNCSNSASQLISDQELPTPKNLQAIPGESMVTIYWDRVKDLNNYNIYWSTVPDVNKNNGTKIQDASSPYEHVGLSNDVTYYYTVTSSNKEIESQVSYVVNAKPKSRPKAPELLSITAGELTNRIDWRVNGGEEFTMYWATSENLSELIANGKANIIENPNNPLVHNNLDSNETYYYAATAQNSAIESELSNILSSKPFQSTLEWLTTVGPGGSMAGQDIVVDNFGNSYIAGTTNAAFVENVNLGYSDAFVAKLNPGGQVLWVKQFGTSDLDEAWGIVLNSTNQIFVVGRSFGDIDGDSKAGGMFISKYDNIGNQVWIKQYQDIDFGKDIDINLSGNLYIVGDTYKPVDGNTPLLLGAVLAKVSSQGELLWVRLIDSAKNDYAVSLVLDKLGYIGITGYTNGDLNNTGKLDTATDSDLFVAKYDLLGNRLWVDQIDSVNSEYDYGFGIDSDVNGNYYVTGYTNGELFQVAQNSDIIFLKYSNSITVADKILTKQFSGLRPDIGKSIFVLDEERVFIGGFTYSDFENKSQSSALWDMLILHLDINGSIQNAYQRYRDTGSRINGLFVDHDSNYYATGYHGANSDVYVLKGFDNIDDL